MWEPNDWPVPYWKVEMNPRGMGVAASQPSGAKPADPDLTNEGEHAARVAALVEAARAWHARFARANWNEDYDWPEEVRLAGAVDALAALEGPAATG
jgi:hypothetical protein